MTPEQKIKMTVMKNCCSEFNDDVTSDNVDELYDDLYNRFDELYDAISVFREGEVETDIECEWSHHYESKSVASKMADGSWVGWTYWYGGGKHGDPESIEWMDSAYFLDVTEEQKMVNVRTFTKVDE